MGEIRAYNTLFHLWLSSAETWPSVLGFLTVTLMLHSQTLHQLKTVKYINQERNRYNPNPNTASTFLNGCRWWLWLCPNMVWEEPSEHFLVRPKWSHSVRVQELGVHLLQMSAEAERSSSLLRRL